MSVLVGYECVQCTECGDDLYPWDVAVNEVPAVPKGKPSAQRVIWCKECDEYKDREYQMYKRLDRWEAINGTALEHANAEVVHECVYGGER